MNKALAAKDFDGATALKLIAVPKPGDTATYFRIAAMEQAAYALFRHIVAYRAIPAHPANDEYRERMMKTVNDDAADMLKAIGNA